MSKVLVWDLPLRLFHWILVLLVTTSIVTAQLGGNAMQIHVLSGYSILTLLLFRVLWGFLGGTHARFASFVRGPRAALDYLRALRRRENHAHLGHNPAGAWSVMLMLAVLLVQATTGLFSNDDIATDGPLVTLISKSLSDRITGIHDFNAGVLYVLIGLHVAAIAFYFFYKRENLINPMITGFKEALAGAEQSARNRGSIWLAVLLLAVCAGAVYLLVNFA